MTRTSYLSTHHLKLRFKLIEKELKEKEEKLFFAEAQVDVDTDKEIEELTNSYNFDVLTSCKFKKTIQFPKRLTGLIVKRQMV